jgi:hypothetical protein
MKYRRRADYVDAVQWNPGVEIDGVVRTGEVGVVTGAVGLRQVRPKDWVVSIGGTIIGVMHPQAFEAMYVAVDEVGKVPAPTAEPEGVPV